MEALVSTQWLAAELGAPDLRVVDATHFAPWEARDTAAEHQAGHIPGALFIDLLQFADQASDLPLMVPPPALAAERLGALGIGSDDRIVLYDDCPFHTAARAWWMLRALGAKHVAILDGGLAKWRAEGRPVESGTVAAAPRRFDATPEPGLLRTLDQMKANLLTGVEQVIDARAAPFFTGEAGDPSPNTARGHIPGSRNIPHDALFEADGSWKRGAALARVFEEAGIDLARPIVGTCGGGVAAATTVFAAHLLGASAALYDGSWSEWGRDPATPKALGPA